MKKIMSSQILFVLVLFISMGCGCEKDPIEPDYPMEITTATLNGTWEFVSLNVPGEGIVTECDELDGFMSTWPGQVLRTYDFNSATEKVNISVKCTAVPTFYPYEDLSYYVLGDDIIIGGVIHSIVDYDNVTGVLEILIQTPTGGGWMNLTLQKI